MLKTLDIAKGTSVLPWYQFFQRTLSWDRAQVEQYQSERLRKLIGHAWETVPYYRDEMNRRGLKPGDFRTAADVGQLPVLDREAIQNNQAALLSSKYSLESLHRGGSSGTTGVPIRYYHDREAVSASIAAVYALWSMSGWQPGQRNVHVWGNQVSVKRWSTMGSRVKNFLSRQKNVASTLLNEPENFPALAQQLIRFNPQSLEGYTSSIYTLAMYFQQQGLRLPNLKQVLTTAENLEPQQQALIEQVFAPVGDLYGSSEVPGVASRPILEGRYYVLEPHVIAEAAESGIPGMKDLLITDLNNYGMPMIRYKIGDMIDELQQPEGNARYPFAWFGKIQGRGADVITLPNGKKFHPVNIFGGTLFRQFPQISKHKVIWDGHALKFVFEANDLTDSRSLQAQLEELLRPYEAPFSIEFTKKILPSASGKHKYVEIIAAATSSVPG